jgi:hypothetical protein
LRKPTTRAVSPAGWLRSLDNKEDLGTCSTTMQDADYLKENGKCNLGIRIEPLGRHKICTANPNDSGLDRLSWDGTLEHTRIEVNAA